MIKKIFLSSLVLAFFVQPQGHAADRVLLADADISNLTAPGSFYKSENFYQDVQNINFEGSTPTDIRDIVVNYTTIYRPEEGSFPESPQLATHLRNDVFFHMCIVAGHLNGSYFNPNNNGTTYRNIQPAFGVESAEDILKSLKYPVVRIISQGQVKLDTPTGAENQMADLAAVGVREVNRFLGQLGGLFSKKK